MEINEYRVPHSTAPQVYEPSSVEPGAYLSEVDHDSPATLIWQQLKILRRQVWKVLAFVCAVTGAVLLYSARITPLYRATAQMEIDTSRGGSSSGAEAAGLYFRDEGRVIQTQLRLIGSPEVAEAVFRDLNLSRRPEFGYAGDADSDAPKSLPGLSAEAIPGTYLIEIAYQHSDPELTRDIANAVAKLYIEQSFESRIQSAQDASNILQIQLEKLRAESEDSQQTLLAYQRRHGIAPTDGRTQLAQQQLERMQEDLITLESARLEAESSHRNIDSGDLQDLLISSQGSLLARQIEKREGLQEQLDQISLTYGPNHPIRKSLVARLESMEGYLEAARKKALERLDAERRALATREQSLNATYLERKAEADRLDGLAVEFGILSREAEAKTSLYEDLLRTVTRVGIESAVQHPDNLRVASWASLPGAPFYPDVPRYLLLAFLSSSVIGVAVALMADHMDRTVRDTDQIEQWLRVPVIANLPRLSGSQRPQTFLLPAANTADGPQLSQEGHALIEGFSMIRTSLMLSSNSHPVKVILVASAVPAEGKSTVAAGLASAMAQQVGRDKRVLLVDGDLRRPTVHSTFSVENREGLSSLLEGRAGIESVIRAAPGLPSLWLLPRGPSTGQPSELLSSNMGRILEDLRGAFEYVIVDSAPLLASADTLILASQVDGVLLVARAGETSRDLVGSALRKVRRVRGEVLGLVLNQVKKAHYDSYNYYYGYNRQPEADDE